MTLEKFAACVGCLTALSLAASLAFASFGYLLECIASARSDRDEMVALDARRNLGSNLVDCSHWFSEDHATWKALNIVGQNLQRSGRIDVSTCRDRWREDARKMADQGEACH